MEVATSREKMDQQEPRAQCLLDLGAWIKLAEERNKDVVVLTNANQSMTEGRDLHNLRDMAMQTHMVRTMEAKHPNQALYSTVNGSKTIDHVHLPSQLEHTINRSGQLLFHTGFLSDHRGIFVDLDVEKLLELYMEQPVEQEGRQLTSKHRKRQTLYLEEVTKKLELQNATDQLT